MSRRRARRKTSSVRQLVIYVGVAVGFALIGFVASLSGRSPGPAVRTDFTALPGRPAAIAVTNDAVYVADDRAGSVLTLDRSDAGVHGLPIHVGANPISLAAANGSLFVGHASGDVTKIALGSGRVALRRRVGGSITSLAVDGSRLWAADLGRGELEEINARSLRVVRRVRGIAPVRIDTGRGRIFATTAHDEVVRYDPASGEIRRTNVGPGPIGLAADADTIWVAVSDARTIVRVNATSMRVSRRVRVGNGPVNVAVLRGVVWVTNNDDRTLMRIDARSSRLIGGAIGVESNLRGVGVGDRLWFVGTDPSGVVRSSE